MVVEALGRRLSHCVAGSLEARCRTWFVTPTPATSTPGPAPTASDPCPSQAAEKPTGS
jgi:hypothetical protein